MENAGFRFQVGLTQRLWESFKRLETESNLENFTNYYRALSTWVKENKKYFGDSILKDFRLDILIELDPDKCVVNHTAFSLAMEKERMFSRAKPKHLEILARSIGNTLWDLATVYSGINCPNCIHEDGLRYVMVENDSTQEKTLVLNCESCGCLQTLNGEKISREGIKIIPANKHDITKHNV